MNPVHGYRDVAKTRCFCRFGRVLWSIAHCFGVPGRFLMHHEPCARLSRHSKNSMFLSFRACFVAITDCFVVPGQFLMLHEPCARLSTHRKSLLFWSFRASFIGYSALHWGPRLIFDAPSTLSTAIETSQKLVVFVVLAELCRL